MTDIRERLAAYDGVIGSVYGANVVPHPALGAEPPPSPLVIKPASLRVGSEIQPRQWLYGTILLRRMVTVVIAPGGVGKTAWSIAAGLSLALGRGLIGDWVHAASHVLFASLEDPEEEFDRRIAAAMLHYGIGPDALRGRVSLIDGRVRHLVMAALNRSGDMVFPDKRALTELIRSLKIDVVFVDPVVNSHGLDENDNVQINALARAWAEVANDTGVAVALIHHTRKGAVPGDPDSGRGASALVGAARATYTLTAATPADAEKLNIAEHERRLHIRLDDAKQNLSPPAEHARWFKLASRPLENGDAAYPNGDNLQVIGEWVPPKSALSQQTPAAINQALDVIAAGLDDLPYAKDPRNGRWAGNVLVDMLGLTRADAIKATAAWLKEGLLFEKQFRDPETRKARVGFGVSTRRPT
jgi:hypothetical protein